MTDHESQHESSSSPPTGPSADSDAVSTVAMPAGAIPPLGEDNARYSPHPIVVSGGSSVFSGTPAVVPTDKTVISKRPPMETPLLPLPTPESLGLALIGRTLDHYELVEFVGGGGMGAVFRSIDTRLGRTVAVKVLSRDHTDEETIKRFRNEAQSAARLDHPNIARVYFVGEAEGWNYIVFEFIEGTNLRDIVEARGPLPLEEALDYTLQVAEALDHASNRDVVHRDIKPSNVLVTPAGQAKLVDMGLARLHQVESSSEDLTASGVMLGTFDYISPEQARDPRSADVRSDIYSLGCTLYFMLTGRPPFPEGTAVQKLLKHNSEEPPDLRLFRPELPPSATSLVGRMLAKRPAQRQQSPQDLIAEVLGLAHQLGLSGLTQQASAMTVSPPPGSYWSRLLPIVVPIAALVLLLLLIDSFSQQTDKPQAFVQQPTFGPGKAQQSLATDQANDAASASADATAEKSGGPAVSKTIDNDSKGNGANASLAQTNADTLPDVGTSGIQEEGTTSGDGGAGSSAAQVVSPPSNVAVQGTGGNPPTMVIERVIVRKDQTSAPVPDNAEIVHSLARACQVAIKHKLDRIELEFDGPLPEPEQPFDLKLPRVEVFAAENPNQAGIRYRPVIVFQPPPFATDSDHQMIRLSGGSRSQITFRGVELRLELPSEPSSNWSLFALYQLQSLEFVDTVLTVKCPGGTQGVVGYEPVAMLALQPFRQAEMMKMTDDMMAMQPSINVRLTNCIARGEATFLRAVEDRPLNVVWNQGLLVTPLRLLESGGTNLAKPSPQDKFEIELNHVTAIVPSGLVRQDRNSMASQQRLEVRCYNSLLSVDRNSYMFEFEGLTSRDDVKLDFDGSENLYPPNSGGFLRVGMDMIELVTDWARGRDISARKVVWLNSLLPPSLSDKPAHEHVPADYRLDPQSDQGGFDPNILKEIFAGPPPATSAGLTGTEADFFERPFSP
ncbi:MAG: serine/threonine-protein kinase [Pirellulaceae bacterium]